MEIQDILLRLLLLLVLIALNAVFAAAEIAVISMNDAKLASLAAAGNKKAVRLARITGKPAKFLATIQVAITLSGFLGSAFAADYFAEPLSAALVKAGVPLSEKTLNTICVILITLLLSYLTLVFGELVPLRDQVGHHEPRRHAQARVLRRERSAYKSERINRMKAFFCPLYRKPQRAVEIHQVPADLRGHVDPL